MKMLRRGGQCAFSKTEATPQGLLGRSSVGQPSLQAAIPAEPSPAASPGAPAEPRQLPGSGARGTRDAHRQRPPAATRAFKEGVGRPEAANQLGTTSEYADGHPGGHVQHQRPATFPAASHTRSPRSQTGKGHQVPSCWLPGWAEAQKNNFPLGFGLETPFRTQDGELLMRRYKYTGLTSSATGREGAGPDPTSSPSSKESAQAFPTSHTIGARRHFGWPGGLQHRTWPRNGTMQEKQQHRVPCLSQAALETAPAALASLPAEHIQPQDKPTCPSSTCGCQTPPHAGAVGGWAKSSHACHSWGFICFASTCLLSMAMLSGFIG